MQHLTAGIIHNEKIKVMVQEKMSNVWLYKKRILYVYWIAIMNNVHLFSYCHRQECMTVDLVDIGSLLEPY